jgi:hypothetical protein
VTQLPTLYSEHLQPLNPEMYRVTTLTRFSSGFEEARPALDFKFRNAIPNEAAPPFERFEGLGIRADGSRPVPIGCLLSHRLCSGIRKVHLASRLNSLFKYLREFDAKFFFSRW